MSLFALTLVEAKNSGERDDDVDMVMMMTPEVIKNFAGLPSTLASPSNLNMLLTAPIIFAVLCLNFSRQSGCAPTAFYPPRGCV